MWCEQCVLDPNLGAEVGRNPLPLPQISLLVGLLAMRVNLSLQGLSRSQLDPPAGTQTSAPFVLEREASPTADQFAQDSLQV